MINFKITKPSSRKKNYTLTIDNSKSNVPMEYANRVVVSVIGDGITRNGAKIISTKKSPEPYLAEIRKKIYSPMNKLEGGLGDNRTIEDLAKKYKVKPIHYKKIYAAIDAGIGVEKEHTNDIEKKKEIAFDHIWETGMLYYKELAKMEKKLESNPVKLEQGAEVKDRKRLLELEAEAEAEALALLELEMEMDEPKQPEVKSVLNDETSEIMEYFNISDEEFENKQKEYEEIAKKHNFKFDENIVKQDILDEKLKLSTKKFAKVGDIVYEVDRSKVAPIGIKDKQYVISSLKKDKGALLSGDDVMIETGYIAGGYDGRAVLKKCYDVYIQFFNNLSKPEASSNTPAVVRDAYYTLSRVHGDSYRKTDKLDEFEMAGRTWFSFKDSWDDFGVADLLTGVVVKQWAQSKEAAEKDAKELIAEKEESIEQLISQYPLSARYSNDAMLFEDSIKLWIQEFINQRDFKGLFEIISNSANKDSRNAYSQISGFKVNSGTTQKEIAKSIKDIYGYDLWAEQEKAEKEKESQRKAEAERVSNEKMQTLKEKYPFINFDGIKPMELARLESVLEKQWRFSDDGIMSRGAWLKKHWSEFTKLKEHEDRYTRDGEERAKPLITYMIARNGTHGEFFNDIEKKIFDRFILYKDANEKMAAGGFIKCPVGTQVQSVLMSKDSFSRKEAVKWVKEHDYSSEIDETGDYYRFRQQEPDEFDNDSFRTIEFTDGIKAVIGCPINNIKAEQGMKINKGTILYRATKNENLTKENIRLPFHAGTLEQAEIIADIKNYGNDAVYYKIKLEESAKIYTTSDSVANIIDREIRGREAVSFHKNTNNGLIEVELRDVKSDKTMRIPLSGKDASDFLHLYENSDYDAIRYGNEIEGEGFSYLILTNKFEIEKMSGSNKAEQGMKIDAGVDGGAAYEGNLHTESGIAATVKETGQEIEFEVGEIVINRVDAQKHCEELSKINSEHGKKIDCECLRNSNKDENLKDPKMKGEIDETGMVKLEKGDLIENKISFIKSIYVKYGLTPPKITVVKDGVYVYLGYNDVSNKLMKIFIDNDSLNHQSFVEQYLINADDRLINATKNKFEKGDSIDKNMEKTLSNEGNIIQDTIESQELEINEMEATTMFEQGDKIGGKQRHYKFKDNSFFIVDWVEQDGEQVAILVDKFPRNKWFSIGESSADQILEDAKKAGLPFDKMLKILIQNGAFVNIHADGAAISGEYPHPIVKAIDEQIIKAGKEYRAIEEAIYGLAGDRNKQRRQELISAIVGEKVPVAKSGISAIEEELKKWILAKYPNANVAKRFEPVLKEEANIFPENIPVIEARKRAFQEAYRKYENGEISWNELKNFGKEQPQQANVEKAENEPETMAKIATTQTNSEWENILLSMIPDAQKKVESDDAKANWDRLISQLKAMPKLYAQDGKKGDTIAYFHYFVGSLDIYLTEFTKSDDESSPYEFYTFGSAVEGGDFEGAYAYFPDWLNYAPKNIELDYYFEPTPLRNIVDERNPYYEKEQEAPTADNSMVNIRTKVYANAYEQNKGIEKFIELAGANTAFTGEDIEFLNRYTGYGGLAKFMDTENVSRTDAVGTLYEYYTPDELCKKLWGLAYKHGYDASQLVLEPSCGIGRIIKYAPNKSLVKAYETNPNSSFIAKSTYRDSEIVNDYFEAEFYMGFGKRTMNKDYAPAFGLVIGNYPFGEYSGKYAAMGEKDYSKATQVDHHFIVRGLDALVSGGLMVCIVNSRFMQSGHDAVKAEIEKRGELIDAYRLPAGVFQNTEVIADILVIRKK